jgi:hypothetical protein
MNTGRAIERSRWSVVRWAPSVCLVLAVGATLSACSSSGANAASESGGNHTLTITQIADAGALSSCGLGTQFSQVIVTDQTGTTVGVANNFNDTICTVKIAVPSESFYTINVYANNPTNDAVYTIGPESLSEMASAGWTVTCITPSVSSGFASAGDCLVTGAGS